jgi:ribonuclease P protein component
VTLHEKDLSTQQCETKENARIFEPHGNSRRTQGAQAAPCQRAQEIDCNRAAETGSHIESRWMPPRARERFPKSARLRKRPEFISLSRTGKKVHSPNFIVISKTNELGESRLGITVSGKIGNALVRNRIKRLVREFFRRRRREWLPATDVLVIARKGAAALGSDLITKELENSIGGQVSWHR